MDFDEYLKLNKTDLEVYIMNAQTQLKAELFKEGLESCEEGLKLNPHHLELKLAKAQALTSLNKYQEVCDLFAALHPNFQENSTLNFYHGVALV